jgi:hypothetical protein
MGINGDHAAGRRRNNGTGLDKEINLFEILMDIKLVLQPSGLI